MVLNQQKAQPIIASAWSKAEGVSGTTDSDYAIYLDLEFADGTELWAKVAGFRPGTHDWQREEVVLFPEKPIKSVDFNLLFRNHSGKAWFRDPQLQPANAQAGTLLFDGVPVVPAVPGGRGISGARRGGGKRLRADRQGGDRAAPRGQPDQAGGKPRFSMSRSATRPARTER